MSEKVKSRTVFNIEEMPQAYEAFSGLELVENIDGSERWNGIIDYGEGENKKSYKVPIDVGPGDIWGMDPSDKEFYDKFAGKWAEVQELKERIKTLEARFEVDDSATQEQPVAEPEPTPAEAEAVGDTTSADEDVTPVTPETPPVPAATPETIADNTEFAVGQTVKVRLETGQVVEGTVASGAWKAPQPDGRDYITVFVEGHSPQYIKPEDLARYQELTLGQPEVVTTPATGEDEAVTPPADVSTHQTTITTETRERRNDRSRAGTAAAIVGAAILGFLAGSGIVAACDRDNNSSPSLGDSMGAVSGSHVDFYNTNPGNRLTGVMLPKKASLKHNSNNTASIVDNSGKTVISKVEWDRQGNLSKATRNDLTKKGYVLVQAKLGDRYMTLAGKS